MWIAIVEIITVSLALFCSGLFWLRLRSGEQVSVVVHWGGLGSGLGGWRATTALVTLCAALLLWAVAGALAIYASQVRRTDEASKRDRERADQATQIRYKREDAKFALDEKHRADERQDRVEERERADRMAAAAAAASTAAALLKSTPPKPAAVHPQSAAPAVNQ